MEANINTRPMNADFRPARDDEGRVRVKSEKFEFVRNMVAAGVFGIALIIYIVAML